MVWGASTLAVPLLLLVGLTGDAKTQPSRTFEVSVDVNLVMLHAAVHDSKGQFASALRQQDLRFTNIRPPVLRLFRHEDIPITVGLNVDHSGSMRQKLTEVIAAARTFVRSSKQEDQVFVVNFNEKLTRRSARRDSIH